MIDPNIIDEEEKPVDTEIEALESSDLGFEKDESNDSKLDERLIDGLDMAYDKYNSDADSTYSQPFDIDNSDDSDDNDLYEDE